MHAPTPRQAPRRHTPVRAALFALVGLCAAACGGAEEQQGGTAGPESQDVQLQPVAAAGLDPFTPSSAPGESAPLQAPLPNRTGKGIRTVSAATPGLYGGTERYGSCDVEQQVSALTKDDKKTRAFAEAAAVDTAKVPDFLRGLTPVVLRADTRVTSHGFRDGRAHPFQSVLQAGTAVLVDAHGMPRVRCAGGNPLLAPRAPKGTPVLKGEQWAAYQPSQVIVIEPTPAELRSLIIVNIADNSWLERTTGDDGAQDRLPQPVPPYDPSDGIPDVPLTPPNAPPNGMPSGPPSDGSRVPAPPQQPAQPPPPAQSAPSAVPPGGPSEAAPQADPGVPPAPDGAAPPPDSPRDRLSPPDPLSPRDQLSPRDPLSPADPLSPQDPLSSPQDPLSPQDPNVPDDPFGPRGQDELAPLPDQQQPPDPGSDLESA
ncbi:DUF6777 domain-containing protein [Streptomyces sp. NPDC044571]|uniref:DUF6777 domain-containing protein n=1 Tax=Streptomyces sp. NPDC044571 TaxID=3155371 RepID=UPI0033E59E2E